MSRAWDKEKIWDSDRIRTYDLPNTGRALFVHFSYEELMESDAIYIYSYFEEGCRKNSARDNPES